MIIIRNNRMDHPREQQLLERNIRLQAINGLIVLPDYCELLHVDPGDNNVSIQFEKYVIDEDPLRKICYR